MLLSENNYIDYYIVNQEKSMRHIIIDLGNCDKESRNGKDLALTNAPSTLLLTVAQEIKTSEYVGLPAEEVFIQKIEQHGYKIEIKSSLEDVETILVSADNY